MTLYQLLKVSPLCTDDELKSAYRKKCKELHPDMTGGDPKKIRMFIAMTDAYRETWDIREQVAKILGRNT